jgi:hypothetical protein
LWRGCRLAQFRRAAADLAATCSRLAQELRRLGDVCSNSAYSHSLENR